MGMNVTYEVGREINPALVICSTQGCTPHIHHQIEIVVVTRGSYTVSEGGACAELHENEAAIADSYIPHTYARVTPDSRASVVIIPKDYLSDYKTALRGKTFAYPFLDEVAGRRVRAFVNMLSLGKVDLGTRSYERTVSSDQKTLVEQGLVNAILGEFVNGLPLADRERDPAFVMHDVLLFLADNFTEQLTLDGLAKRFGYAPTHFSRLFNAYTGLHLAEYLGLMRVEYAAGLLRNGQSVTAAAMNAGFQSMRTFYRVFAETYRCTPKELLARSGNSE